MLISDNPRFGRRTQEMLRLVPLDKEKNEESKVEDVASPVLFTASFFCCCCCLFPVNIFMRLEENNLVFPKTH